MKQLVFLFKLFKNFLQLIQKRNGPSLYIVLPCTLTLEKALFSFDELLKYENLKLNITEQDIEETVEKETELLD